MMGLGLVLELWLWLVIAAYSVLLAIRFLVELSRR